MISETMTDTAETEDLFVKDECASVNVKVELIEEDTPLNFNLDEKADCKQGMVSR